MDHRGKTANRKGRDYYVIQSIGRDTASGTFPKNAFKTLKKASQVAAPGDRVFVGTGIYEDALQPAKSGRLDARIEFIAFQPGAIITNTAANVSRNTEDRVCLSGKNYVIVEGFEFRRAHMKVANSNGTIIRNNLMFESGILLGNSNNFLVEGNRLARSWLVKRGNNIGSGIAVGSGSNHGTVRQNVVLFQRNSGSISGERTGKTKNVTHYTSDIVLEGNLFGFHGEHGVTLAWARDIVVRRNVFCWGVNGGLYFGRNDVQNARIYNNTWYRAEWYMQPWPDTVSLQRRNEFRNNIFAGLDVFTPGKALRQKYFTYMPLEPAPGEREFTLDYSLYFPAKGIAQFNTPDKYFPNQPPVQRFDTLEEWQAVSKNDLHSLTGDPQFADPDTFDFRLLPTRPCIDTGDPLSPVPSVVRPTLLYLWLM